VLASADDAVPAGQPDSLLLRGRAMRLYHFLNAEYGLLSIRNRRLKIARVNDLTIHSNSSGSRQRGQNCDSAISSSRTA
jgi:hypothetical protein